MMDISTKTAQFCEALAMSNGRTLALYWLEVAEVDFFCGPVKRSRRELEE
jgi:hypothetical protein